MKPQLFLGPKPTKERMSPIKNNAFIKGGGGLWTSTHRDGTSSWVEWCESEDFWNTDDFDLWELEVRKDVKLLTIDSVADLNGIFDTYGTNYKGVLDCLDFERMALDYDGLWLTERGQIETRFGFPRSFYGWDCESTHWFHWAFESVTHVGKLQIEFQD